MKKEMLSENLSLMKESLKTLKSKRFRYFIHGKYIPGYGALQLIDNVDSLVNAFGFIKSQFKSENTESELMSELNINPPKKSDKEQLYLGYTLAEWTSEFKTKVEDLKNDLSITQLESAIKKFKSYRTEEDKFAEDVNKFASLFDELGIGKNENEIGEIESDSNRYHSDDKNSN